jgi:hypothetical protein
MAFRVEHTAQAKQDSDGILEWLLEQGAGETGLRWFLRLEDAIDTAPMNRSPLAGGQLPFRRSGVRTGICRVAFCPTRIILETFC